ncbi:MAG: PAS domain S-box protein, partial [Spirulinaceae cyanobacterium RM2_2_10]|nr:PAS domain S-box protein [Spirulinaceae cyanobacterium RM2_2_10]
MWETLQLFSSLAADSPTGSSELLPIPLVTWHVLSAGLTAITCWTLAYLLLAFIRRRHDLPYRRLVLLFSACTILWGLEQLLAIWRLWLPADWLSGSVQTATALMSGYTAVVVAIALFRSDNTAAQATASQGERENEAALVAQLRDRTAELAAANVIRRYHQTFLSRILDTITDPIFVKDRQHRWVTVNEAFCRLMNQPRAVLLGKSEGDFLTVAEADTVREHETRLFAGQGDTETEEQITTGNGKKLTVLTKRVAFADEHNQPILVGIVRDITARKQLEEKSPPD